MKEKDTHAGTNNMQYRARAVSNATMDSATSEEIERRRRQAKRKQRQRRLEKIERQTTINRRRAGAYSIGQVLAITICCAAFFMAAIVVVHAEASLKSTEKTVAKLQEEYETLVTGNDVLKSGIIAGIDINEIYRMATQEMGMAYPKKSQVILYQKTESEHVKQNEDIP